MEGTPSTRNIHCQPARPNTPFSSSRLVASGPPITPVTGMRQHERGDDPRAIGAGEPVGQVQDHAGEEAGLEQAEQEAHDEEAGFAAHEGHSGRREAPGNHDAGDPDPRAKPIQHQVAGHFEDEIADEEDRGAEAVDIGREAEVAVHRQRREAEVHAVDQTDDVEHEDERQQPLCHLPDGGFLEVCHCFRIPPLSWRLARQSPDKEARTGSSACHVRRVRHASEIQDRCAV